MEPLLSLKPRLSTADGPVDPAFIELIEVRALDVRVRYTGLGALILTRIECPEGGEVPPIPGFQFSPGAELGVPRMLMGAFTGTIQGTGDVIRNGQVVRDAPIGS